MLRFSPLVLSCALCLAQPPAPAHSQHSGFDHGPPPPRELDSPNKDDHKIIDPNDVHNPVLWHDPGNIAAKDLFYGAGGPANQPEAPLTFIERHKHGSSPKFDARDARHEKWRVKLGPEARPEVVASRLLWAVGYYTEYDYVLPQATVYNLHMGDTADSVRNHDQVIDARYARKPPGEKRIASWAWKENPFFGTREFNGLRVMIALINDWDLKDDNNAVYSDKKTGQQIFLVSDTGASFGSNSLRMRNETGKGNIEEFEKSTFIIRSTSGDVSFGTPAPPHRVVLESAGILFPMYFRRNRYDWIGDNIPREDARWIGSLLGQLTHKQLVDAFRAGHFPPGDVNRYVDLMEQRIAALNALKTEPLSTEIRPSPAGR